MREHPQQLFSSEAESDAWYAAHEEERQRVEAGVRNVQPMSERQARESTTCMGCGREKAKALIVCWDCFKYTKPVPTVEPLQYSGLSFETWQERIEAYFDAAVMRG